MRLAELLDSPALGLLLRMERDELEVEATDDDRIRISPATRLDAERLAEVRRYKPELLGLIRMCDEGVRERLVEYRTQLAGTPAPQVPAFLFRPGVPYQPGICFSCGDILPLADRRTVESHRTDGTTINVTLTERFGRCWRCSLAWRLAAGTPLPVAIAQARDEAKGSGSATETTTYKDLR